MSRDKTLLHPELLQIVREFEIRCKAAGLNVLVTETYRTKAEQDALYAKGRTMPGNIVTNCRYPNSPHCWGVAFDFCRNVRGREYDDSDGFFKKCGEIGKSLGLFWGGDFKSFVDKPHLELAKYLPNNSVKTLIRYYGTPDNWAKNWVEVSNTPTAKSEEDETMTYEKFKNYMDKYMAELADEPVPDWAKAELQAAVDLGITDGTRPMQLIPRYQAAIMAKRAALHMITL
jgi:peptidoglycan L-alanyl-D-glutamate endopeptidase CwlK